VSDHELFTDGPSEIEDLEPLIIAGAMQRVASGSVSVEALVSMFAPAPAADVPPQAPPAKPITAAQTEALKNLVSLYGSVSIDVARELTAQEVSLLLKERDALATVEKMVADRKDSIRTMVLLHNDVAHTDTQAQAQAEAEAQDPTQPSQAWQQRVDTDVDTDKDGHLCIKARIEGEPGSETCFSIEPKAGSKGRINPAKIAALAEDPNAEWITHQDWLDCTDQERVLSEPKLLLLLKRKPSLVRMLPLVTERQGRPSITVIPRNA